MGSNKRYPSDKGPNGTQRHCWVLATRTERGPWPGLILEWRRLPSREWQARVVYVPDHAAPRSIEDWFHQSMLRPIDVWPSERVQADARMARGGA